MASFTRGGTEQSAAQRLVLGSSRETLTTPSPQLVFMWRSKYSASASAIGTTALSRVPGPLRPARRPILRAMCTRNPSPPAGKLVMAWKCTMLLTQLSRLRDVQTKTAAG